MGKVVPDHNSDCLIDRIYDQRVFENKLLLLNEAEIDYDLLHENEITKSVYNGCVYWLNTTKGLVIKDTRTPAMVKDYQIPVYGKQVHFKDVLQQVIKNGFDAYDEDYLPELRVQLKFMKKWKFKTKRVVTTQELDLYMGARLIYNKYIQIKQSKDIINHPAEYRGDRIETKNNDKSLDIQIPDLAFQSRFYEERKAHPGNEASIDPFDDSVPSTNSQIFEKFNTYDLFKTQKLALIQRQNSENSEEEKENIQIPVKEYKYPEVSENLDQLHSEKGMKSVYSELVRDSRRRKYSE